MKSIQDAGTTVVRQLKTRTARAVATEELNKQQMNRAFELLDELGNIYSGAQTGSGHSTSRQASAKKTPSSSRNVAIS